MKELLIYISPNKKFNPEHELMLEVQRENSNPMLVTNFPYEGATEVPDLINAQYPENPRAIINSKIDTIIYLLENKIITETTWFHDFDAFQLTPFEVELEKDLGCVTYGIYPQNRLQPLGDYKTRINCGSIFFKPSALDLLKTLLERMNRNKHYEEDELTIMYAEDPSRIQIMDQSYNIGIRTAKENAEIAEKPLKIAHFPPDDPKWFGELKPYLPDKLRESLEKRFEKIVITGCNGFIGSHLVKRLNATGVSVDVRYKDQLREHFKNARVVIHTAVSKDGQAREMYDTNVVGTRNVVELCEEYGCKLIFLGTVETREMYGVTKQMAERIVRNSGIPAVSLKLPPIYTEEMLPAKHGYYPMEKLLDRIEEIIKTDDFKYRYEEFHHIR